MSRIPAALAYLVIYNPTLRPNPEDLVEGRDEDDAAEQAHILFYTARERAVSRDRMLRQVGLAKALANFAEMFTSQPGFDNVHAQKSRLVMVSPEPNFWIHACIDLAKTPRAATKSGPDAQEQFDYHGESLNDDVLKNQLIHAFRLFKLQYGGFSQIMKSDGIRTLERQIESFFTPWAWQWNVGAAPEFGAYLGIPIHPLKKQLSAHVNEYVAQVADTPTLVLAPPHIVTTSSLAPISPGLPLARFLENLVPPHKPKPSPSPPLASTPGSSAPKHMLVASGNAVTKYITKPAAQVVDPRNWSWPAYMSFGKGSLRGKEKERGKLPSIDTGAAAPTDEDSSRDTKQKDLLEVPAQQDPVPKASRSVSPSTVDHESLREAQLDPGVGNVDDLELALSTPLPADSDWSISPTNDSEVAEHDSTTPRARLRSPPPEESADLQTSGGERLEDVTSVKAPPDERESNIQLTNLPVIGAEGLTEGSVASPAAPEITPVQVQSSTRAVPEATSGSLYLWLDSVDKEDGIGSAPVTRKQKITWIAVPGLLLASVVADEREDTWRDAALELLFSSYETIQSRQLTAAETTLRALSTAKVIAHYPASQMSASSALPQFTSESPHLFASARALQFSTAPTIREIVTQTRWGTWCAARQLTLGTRLYVEVDRKDANLVDIDQELGSACRRWETDA